MKKNVWTWMLAAGMVLAGCSDDLDENGGGGNNVLDGETSFVKVALNLPSTSGSIGSGAFGRGGCASIRQCVERGTPRIPRCADTG